MEHLHALRSSAPVKVNVEPIVEETCVSSAMLEQEDAPIRLAHPRGLAEHLDGIFMRAKAKGIDDRVKALWRELGE